MSDHSFKCRKCGGIWFFEEPEFGDEFHRLKCSACGWVHRLHTGILKSGVEREEWPQLKVAWICADKG